MKEHQDKLREARLRALAGDPDSDDEDEGMPTTGDVIPGDGNANAEGNDD